MNIQHFYQRKFVEINRKYQSVSLLHYDEVRKLTKQERHRYLFPRYQKNALFDILFLIIYQKVAFLENAAVKIML